MENKREIKKKLEVYSTKDLTKKDKIKDISPLYIDFILNPDKSIYPSSLPTGCGKSYGFNVMVNKILQSEDSDKYNKIFYLCDTNKNVTDAYNDFVKKNKGMKDKAIRVYSKLNCIEENELAFKKLKEPYREFDSYNEIVKLLSYTSLKTTDMYKNSMNQLIDSFIYELSITFDKIKKENNFSSSDELLEFIEKNENLNGILEIFPIMRYKQGRVFFMTIHKAMLPINTIIEKRYIQVLHDKKFVNNSIYFFDEADFLSSQIAKIVSDDGAKMNVNIVDVFRSIEELKKFKINHSWMSEEKRILFENKLNSVIERVKMVKKKYYINQRTLIKDTDKLFLFCDPNSIIFSNKNEESYFINDDEDIIIRIANPGENTSKYVTLKELATDISDLYYEIFEILREFCNAYKNQVDPSYSFLDVIKMAIDQFFGTGYSSKEKDIIANHIDHSKRLTSKDTNGKDFYEYPGVILKISQPTDGLGIAINAYELYSTPEKILKNMCDKGAKIFLSSATIKNKSVYRNFNLSWPPIANKIYKQTELQNILEQNYIRFCDKYGDKVHYNLLRTFNDIEYTENIIISFFDKEAEEIKDLLDETKRKMLNNNKNNDDNDDNDNHNNDYYYQELLNMLFAMLTFYKNKYHFTFAFSNFSLKNKKHEDMKKCIYEIAKIINRRNEKINVQICVAENINQTLEDAQKNVLEYQTTIIFTTYPSAEKGINPHYVWKGDKTDIVAINDLGEEALKNKKIKVDVDGLYLGPITNILNLSQEDIESTRLNAMYHYNALKYNKEIDENEYAEVMKDLGKPSFDGSVSFENKTNMTSFTHKKFATIQQCVGRMFRSNTRHKNACIIVNDKLINDGSLSVTDIYEEGINNLQYGMQKVLTSIFNNDFDNNDSYKDPLLNERKDVEAMTKASADIIYNKKRYVHTDTSSYKDFRQKIKHLFITKEELDNLRRSPDITDKELSDMYIPSFENGYTYKEETDDNGMSYTRYIYPLFVKRCNYRTVQKTNIGIHKYNNNIINFLTEQGFHLDPPNTENYYVLTPEGYSILCGNIGETITELYCSQFGYILSDLPDEIYEKADFLIDKYEKEDLIFVIDSKYYNDVAHKKYDDNKENTEKFYQKANDIKTYYCEKNKKDVRVVYIVLNTRIPNESHRSSTELLDNNITLIKIPQIFFPTTKEFDKSLNNTIKKQIDEWRKINA